MKRTFRWSQLLKPEREEVTAELQQRFDKGKAIHEEIQSNFPFCRRELSGVHEEEALPFNIAFHADLVNRDEQVVYEIKPAKWWAQNHYYCLNQASGYFKFTEAKYGYFILYTLDNNGNLLYPLNFVPFTPISWAQLKILALDGYRKLAAEAPINHHHSMEKQDLRNARHQKGDELER